MNILVTGSNGQLGNEMVRVSGKSKERYVFTDIAELDITKLDAVLSLVRKEQIDVIVNCAAYTNVDKAEDDEKTADLINHVAVGYLAAAAKSVNATLIHISTDDGTDRCIWQDKACRRRSRCQLRLQLYYLAYRMAILGMGQELRENHAEIDGRERYIACHFRPNRYPDFCQ